MRRCKRSCTTALAQRRLDIAEQGGQLRVVLPKADEPHTIDYDVKDLAAGKDAAAVGQADRTLRRADDVEIGRRHGTLQVERHDAAHRAVGRGSAPGGDLLRAAAAGSRSGDSEQVPGRDAVGRVAVPAAVGEAERARDVHVLAVDAAGRRRSQLAGDERAHGAGRLGCARRSGAWPVVAGRLLGESIALGRNRSTVCSNRSAWAGGP